MFFINPLPLVCVVQDLYVAHHCIGDGVDVDAKDRFGQTPLFLAAFLGNLAMCTLLVESGADACWKDNHGDTARQMALDASHATDGTLVNVDSSIEGNPSVQFEKSVKRERKKKHSSLNKKDKECEDFKGVIEYLMQAERAHDELDATNMNKTADNQEEGRIGVKVPPPSPSSEGSYMDSDSEDDKLNRSSGGEHSKFNIGDAVMRKNKRGVPWTEGKVTEVYVVEGGHIVYDLTYAYPKKMIRADDDRSDDGDDEVEIGVEGRLLRLAVQPVKREEEGDALVKSTKRGKHRKQELKVGDKVEGRFAGKDKWFPGMHCIFINCYIIQHIKCSVAYLTMCVQVSFTT